MTTFHTKTGHQNGFQVIVLARKSEDRSPVPPSIVVRASQPKNPPPARTIAEKQNGISRKEAERLSEAVHWMASRGPAIKIDLNPCDDDEDFGALSKRADRVKNHIRTFQSRHGGEPYWAEVIETRPRPHVHIVAAAPPKKAKRMCRAIEGSSVLGDVRACIVTEPNGLVDYLTKEKTTEAWFAAGRRTRRVKGPHKLPSGGDRQRLSRDLKADLIAAGRIEDYTRTNARRASKVINADALSRDFDRARHGLFFLEDLPEMPGAQKSKGSNSRTRSKRLPPSLPLNYPPTVPEVMTRLAATHREIGERLGLSRPQTTNIIQGRFGVSRNVARRVLELARAAA